MNIHWFTVENKSFTKYGKDEEEAAHLHRQELSQQITQEYADYAEDPYIVLWHLSYLFDKRTLEEEIPSTVD